MHRLLIAALIAAALIALAVPAAREVVAMAALVTLFVVSYIRHTSHQAEQVREDLALAEQVCRRMSRLI